MTSSSAIRRAAVAVPAADSRPCLPQLLCYALGIISHALCSCEKRQALWSARQSDRQLSAPCTPGVQQDWACCPPRPLFPSPAEAAASPKRSFCTKPGESPSEQGAGAGQRQPSSPRHTVNRRLPCAAGRPRAAGGGLGAAASAAALAGLPWGSCPNRCPACQPCDIGFAHSASPCKWPVILSANRTLLALLLAAPRRHLHAPAHIPTTAC